MARPRKFQPEAVVEKAMEVFWEKGYAAATPQELGERMGLGRGSLYNTFESKHGLFEHALRHYLDHEAVKLLALLQRPGPVKQRLRALMLAIIEIDLADPERRGCMAINTAIELAGRDASATKLAARMFDQTEAAFLAVIQEGQRTGELAASQDAEALAALLLNTLTGLRVLGKTAEDATRLERIVDTVLKAL
ncbi:TetR/AcrR family transcriptional regulator [Corallococcus carmarthensis]|uniref:TetR/AcrR family transcriptional regulator n=1 Tax=Corallococcus carmarthensis TaxID=2316728 RepID=A0A3A8KSN3_9BACT|nr:TetR/AcrR family transcriptional regulator [Corallococcus carmarthensis]NOK16469.1 TetR/AcrR family transcriptional regulator [Corallococcus carmarthensis]RKH07225.1 TetR/AcrR family transcriptional regulator [Corallococcus carmarthensis]